jgi:DNA polymerase-3 subunit gamma/tau
MTDTGYRVLARRWRPRRFDELMGQDVVARTLKNALQSGNIAHAYLLTGIRGVGKTTIARLMAMALNCTHRDANHEPCNQCDTCQSIARGSHMDVLEMDAASHTGVDDMREILDAVRYPPNSLAYRIYIIDEVHMLSRNAFNALLKTLEEPPAQVLFILATTDVDKLPVTVRSRCQRFDLRRLTVPEITQQLRHIFDAESITAEDNALHALATAADGSMRDALSLAERVLAYTAQDVRAEDVQQSLGLLGPALPRQLTDAIVAGDAQAGLSLLQQAAAQGYSARPLLLALAALWHQASCVRVSPEMMQSVHDEDHRQWLDELIARWSHSVLDMHYQILIHGMRDLSLVDEQCGAEMIVLRLCYVRSLTGETPLPVAAHADEKKKPLTPASIEATTSPSQEEEEAILEGVLPPNLDLSAGTIDSIYASQEATRQYEMERYGSTNISKGSEPVLEAAAAPLLPAVSAGHGYDSWEAVVNAYAEVNASMTAMMEHVVCTAFGDTVRLSLDTHHQRAMPQPERVAFEQWLGRNVIWDTRHHDDNAVSISTQRQQHQERETRHRWEHARQDPHLQALMQTLNATLLDVLPAGHDEAKE